MTLQSDQELKLTQDRINQFQRMLNEAQQRYAKQPETLASMRTLYVGQIQDLQYEISDYLGITKTSASAFELAFDTQEGADGVTKLSTLSMVTERFRKSLQNIAETIMVGQERGVGRHPVDVSKQVDLRVVGFATGSFRVLLELPAQRTLGEGLAERSIKAMTDGLLWLQEPTEGPPTTLKDLKVQRTVLREIQRMSPTEGGPVAWVEIRGTTLAQRPIIRMTSGTMRSASTRLQELIAQETVDIIGRVRALDFDKNRYVLTDRDGHRHPFTLEAALRDDAIEYAVRERQVIVHGVRKGKGRRKELHVYEFEPATKTPAKRAKTAPKTRKTKTR